ncbi:autotransporter domain-containing protein [Brucella anthropi]|uniref:autotransporter domain-containing protein n=2 Tax=Brucella anthropi TaxID=529 RepID=UPI002673E3C3|nr:autotransporter domain-containing protein [Brucella anthropi]WKT95217.1 autotransporter domain-containing protein [Brucella anthropi]
MVFKDILILNFILFFTKELKQNIFLYNKNYIFRKIIHSVFGISLTFMALLFPTGNSFAQNEHYDYKFQVGKPVNTKVILPGEHGSATWYPCNYKNDCDEIPGLKYRTDNSKLGYIEGTPTKAGDYLFSFFQNKVFGNEYAYVGVHVDPADVVITTASLSPGRIGVTYPATTLAATGGSGAYTWSANKLPADLTLDATSGIITGTPTEAGSFDVKVTATDKEGHEGHMTYTLVIAAAPTIEIAPKALPAGKVNLAYAETTLSVSGGTAPYTYKVEGLPEGLSLTGDKIKGTPTEARSFDVKVTATDKEGYEGHMTYTLVIAAAPTIEIAPDALPAGKINQVYAETTLSVSGGTAPYTYKVEGLPEGLSLTGNKIAGTPTEARSFDVKVTATDKEGYEGHMTYTLVIAAAPTIEIAPDALPAGKINQVYAETTLSVSGGTAPYTYKVEGLPEGLSLTGNKIAGTPTEARSFDVKVTATDKEGYEGHMTYTLVVAEALPVAQSHSMRVMAGTTAFLNLTEGATEGPFTDARIITTPEQSAGHTWIKREGKAYFLYFAASTTFSGGTKLTYSLANARGASNPAVVTIDVVARPDPSKDEEVIGLVRAQVDTANQLAKTQLENFNQRLEQLHSDAECRANSVGINLSLDGQQLHPDLNVLDKLRQADPNEACSSFRRKFSVWTNGALAYGKNDDDNGTNQKNSGTSISGGIDYRFSPSFTGGIGFGYGRVVTDIGERGTRNDGDMFSTALYGSFRSYRNMFLDGVLGYGWLQFDSNRYVTATGETASGQRLGKQVFGSVTLGYEYRNDAWLLSPYARLDAAHTMLGAFDETGAGIFNLAFDKQAVDLLSTTVGIRSEYSVPMDWGILKLRGRLEYSHDFAGASQARIGYADIGGFMPYAIEVDASYRDSFKIGVGVDNQIGRRWSLGLDYSTQIGTTNGALQHSFTWKLSRQFSPGKP